jgi:peptidoglycan/xylan/chitin deacetylase (PgdA/CDA1 family)
VTPIRPTATLSLDLDNEWSYLKTHGDASWVDLPSYIDRAVGHGLELCAQLGVTITWFLIGQDAEVRAHHEALRSLIEAGHEIGNHSFHHEPWIHRADRTAVAAELTRAEDAIEAATDVRPDCFRGPGYAMSPILLTELAARGYRYDASSLPTVIGPLARAYYFRRARLSSDQREQRSALFGSWSDARRPLKPYRWRTAQGSLLELPVTVLPGARVPFHISYVLYLAARSPAVARRYFLGGLALCRRLGVTPSILVHPLDLLGGDDVASLAFFPAMSLPGAKKRDLVAGWLADLCGRFDVVTLGEHAATLNGALLRELDVDDLDSTS